MKKYKRNYIKELWRNRPWYYLPSVWQFMKKYPYHKSKHSSILVWLRNCFYMNWQVCLEPASN